MNILYVSLEPINSGSSAATCSNMIIKGLLELGYKVEILTIKRDIYKNLPVDNELLEKCTFSYLGSYSDSIVSNNSKETNVVLSSLKAFFKTIYRKLSVYNYSYLYLRTINASVIKETYYDLVISSSDPVTSHKAVYKLQSCGISFGKWIQHWGDPLAMDINKQCIWPRFVLRMIEKRIIVGCDRIVYVSPFTLKIQKDLYKSFSEKMTYVIPATEFSDSYSISTKPVLKLIYAGIYYSSIRNIMPLYNAIADDINYELTIAGNSDLSLDNTNNITVLGQIPHTTASKLESESDVIVCILNNSGTQIPAKAYYYAGTNKPILVIYDKYNKDNMEIVEFLESFNRFTFSNNDEQSIKNSLLAINSNREAVPYNLLNPMSVASNLLGV